MLSTRTHGPPGGMQRLIRPGDGMKSSSGSSALMRNSMAWPRSGDVVLGDGQALAGGDADLPVFTMSMPVTISVTVCSTWTRVFISMK